MSKLVHLCSEKIVLPMKVEMTQQSRLKDIDFNNLPFGKNMSDHMLVCHFKNGAWQEPEIRPYGQLEFSYGLHALAHDDLVAVTI